MSDPFAALKNALEPILMRNSKGIYPEINALQKTLEHFQHDNKRNFFELLKVIRTIVPYIEKWHVDFDRIRAPLDSLNQALKLPVINWDIYLSHSNASPKFQFGALHPNTQDAGLLPWLEKTAGPSTHTMLERLIKLREHFGFSQKLNTHLKQDPDFLFRLIIESEEHFTKITRTRLVLFLTDKQLAEAIIKHIPCFVQSHDDSLTQATQLIEKLNEILSNGRSVSTLLRNAEAKLILDNSELLQLYTNAESQETSTSPPTSLPEEGGITPGI